MVKPQMTSMRNSLFLVAALFAVVFVTASVSAFGAISSIEVSGVEALPSGSVDVAAFAGQTIPVRVIFDATGDARDVRVKAWIVGDREFAVSSDRFVADSGKTYSRFLSLRVPFDLDEEKENLEIRVLVESRNEGQADEKFVKLGAQRESYIVEILDVDMNTEVKAGDALVLDVVLKNRGREEAEDTFVRASIPKLGISDKGFFGDLSSIDQDNPEKFDSEERRLAFRIPTNTPAGVYMVEIEAFNADSATTITRQVSVVSAGNDSIVVSPVSSKTFGIGETETYSMTIANAGSSIAIYELVLDTPTGLNVEVSDPIVALPAGTSKTVNFKASANKDDDHRFSVDVISDGQLVTTKHFAANVEENGGVRNTVGGPNGAVLLTVVLAIVFIVLLVVLIVLLTRKTEKSEEFGESYY